MDSRSRNSIEQIKVKLQRSRPEAYFRTTFVIACVHADIGTLAAKYDSLTFPSAAHRNTANVHPVHLRKYDRTLHIDQK